LISGKVTFTKKASSLAGDGTWRTGGWFGTRSASQA